MDFTFNIRPYLQTVLPNELSQFEFHLTLHCRLFDMLSLVFDAVGVAVFVVYHFEFRAFLQARHSKQFYAS